MKYAALLLAGCTWAACMLPAMAYESRGARSCEAWLAYRQDEQEGYLLNAEVLQTWIVGYLSGIVAGSGMDFLAGTDNSAVFLMVDTYCGQHRQMNLSGAGTQVARELMQQKGIVNQGTLP